MDEKQQAWFRSAQQYDDDEAGHWVGHQMMVLPQNARVRDAMRMLRREHPDYCDVIYLINRAGQFSEAVKISSVLGEPDHIPLVDLRKKSLRSFVVRKTGRCRVEGAEIWFYLAARRG